MNESSPLFGQPDIVYLSDEDAATHLLEGTIVSLWDVVSELTRLRRTTRANYRVTIFGSARLEPSTPAYDGVRKLAAGLTEMGCDIITGGGPGLMQAANEGASSVDPELRRSVGIRVDLPFEQAVNPYVGKSYDHRTFFSRLHHFMIVSDAFVITPGGIGTLLELSMAWQLLQVSRLHNVPLILVGSMWKELVDWAGRHMLTPGHELASREDFGIPICVDGIGDCIDLLRNRRDEWLAAQATAKESRTQAGA